LQGGQAARPTLGVESVEQVAGQLLGGRLAAGGGGGAGRGGGGGGCGGGGGGRGGTPRPPPGPIGGGGVGDLGQQLGHPHAAGLARPDPDGVEGGAEDAAPGRGPAHQVTEGGPAR